MPKPIRHPVCANPAIALILTLHPQQVTELHRLNRRDVAERLSAHVPTQPLSQQQDLGQAELRPCGMCLGMETTRDDVDCLTGAGDERDHLSK